MVQAAPLFDDFLTQLSARALQKRDELLALYAERERVAACIRKAEQYVNDLNALLRDEDLDPIALEPAAPKPGTGFAAPGNRSANMPQRRPVYDGLSIPDAVEMLLSESGSEFHADELARKIYDLKRPGDLRLAKRSLVSTLASGVKTGRWERSAPNTYRANSKGGI